MCYPNGSENHLSVLSEVFRHMNIEVRAAGWLFRQYGILLLAANNLLRVRNGSCILSSPILPRVVRSGNIWFRRWQLERSQAHLVHTLHVQSHVPRLCWSRDEKMRVIERMAIKGVRGRNWHRWRNTSHNGFLFPSLSIFLQELICLKLFLFTLPFFFFLPPPQEKQRRGFNIERAEQISHMDMHANLGDDEAILWGLNRALWWCKLKRRPLKSGIGGLIAYALRQIKAFSEVTHLHSDITGAMGTWQPRLWTVFLVLFFFLSKEALWKTFLVQLEQESRNFPVLPQCL